MPHKHTRRKGGDDASFNLAPSAIAKPLAAYNKDNLKSRNYGKGKGKIVGNNDEGRRKVGGEHGYKHDDTPRAFARMMALQSSSKRQRSGLDDGEGRPSKKKKRKQSQADDAKDQPSEQADTTAAEVPKILPCERLADFAARVNQALPVGGLARKGKVSVEGLKERQTKTEKRLHKMYDAWHEEEARRKEQAEEQRELAEEAEEEKEAALGVQSINLPTTTSSSRKRKRSRMIGETGDDDDPWAELKAKRDAPRGLHDVAQAPPDLKKVRAKFKVQDGARVKVMDVPSKAGSLKRREELSDARREVIERYRTMMGKGGG